MLFIQDKKNVEFERLLILSSIAFSGFFFFKSRKHFHCQDVQHVLLYKEEGTLVQFWLRLKNLFALLTIFAVAQAFDALNLLWNAERFTCFYEAFEKLERKTSLLILFSPFAFGIKDVPLKVRHYRVAKIWNSKSKHRFAASLMELVNPFIF